MNSRLLGISLAVALCCWLRNSAVGAPTVSAKSISNGVDYLVKFGYLVRKDPRNGQIMSQSDLVQSIQSLQLFGGLNVTGILDAATIALMGKSRCGVPDKSPADKAKRKRRYTLHGTYWKKKDVTYRVKGYTRDISRADQDRIYKWAFGLWSKASKIRVTEAPRDMSDDKVDIQIDWKRFNHGDGYPFDGPGGTLAHAFYPHNNKGISGDAHFDDDERYTTGKHDGVNLDWVALHEFGHSLGLDHSTVSGSIMFPWYQGYRKTIKLTEDDLMGIQGIYGKPGRPVPTEDPTSGFKNTGPVPSRIPHTGLDECRLPKYDAWLYDNDKTYAFVGDYYFIVNPYSVGVIDGPLKITDKWKDVRTPINAVYKRPDQRIVFFKGANYWQYFGDYLEHGPRSISYYRLPKELKAMDGAFVWGRNQRTYLFKGNKYWRFNEGYRRIDPGYPRNISVWKGIPSGVDSVMKWKNGKTYFFKGKKYYKLDDYTLQVESAYPKSIPLKWMRCDHSRLVAPTTIPPTQSISHVNAADNRSSSSTSIVPSLIMLVCSLWAAAARGI